MDEVTLSYQAFESLPGGSYLNIKASIKVQEGSMPSIDLQDHQGEVLGKVHAKLVADESVPYDHDWKQLANCIGPCIDADGDGFGKLDISNCSNDLPSREQRLWLSDRSVWLDRILAQDRVHSHRCTSIAARHFRL
jgi:hypothetical protein